jgi:hypothetical protein
MDHLIARENIRHLRDRLKSEFDHENRSRLHRLLIAEEDRLGATLDMLSQIDRQIANTKALIARLSAVVTTMTLNGRDGGKDAALLDGLESTQLVIESYRQRVLTKLNEQRTWRGPKDGTGMSSGHRSTETAALMFAQ